MNILFANTIRMFGGGEVWMLRTLGELKKRGHRVALLCRPKTELAVRAEEQGIQVFRMEFRGDFGPLAILRTALLLRRESFDAVLANMDKELRIAGLAAKLIKRCVVIPRRGVDYPLKNKLHYRLSYNWLSDCVIANSQATKAALLKNAPWLGERRIHVIYNGIDPTPFLRPAKADLRSVLGLSNETALIGFVGQLDERKGIASLLAAFVRTAGSFPKAHLLLAGEGPLKTMIGQFASDHGLVDRIHLLGFQKNVEEVMKGIDMLVLPSLWEGFGIVLIEAMAAGKPAITTNVSSMPEIVIDGQTGRLVPVNDSSALSAAMNELLADPLLAASWGESGRQRVAAHFTIDQMIDQLERLFHEQVDRKRGPHS